MSLFIKKPLGQLLSQAEGSKELRRTLGPGNLVALGVGAIIPYRFLVERCCIVDLTFRLINVPHDMELEWIARTQVVSLLVPSDGRVIVLLIVKVVATKEQCVRVCIVKYQ